MQGIELFLSSEKAVEGANKFRAAVEAAAASVERMGAVAEKADGSLATIGQQVTGAAPALKKLGADAATVGRQLNDATPAAVRLERQLASLRAAGVASAAGMRGLETTSRSVGQALRALSGTPIAREVAEIASAFAGATVASRALGAALDIGAMGAFATVATAVGFALAGIGVGADKSTAQIRKLIDESREAESAARRLDQLRQDIIAGGDARAGQALVETLGRDLVRLNEQIKLGVKDVPAEQILGAIEQRAPETIAALRLVMDEMRRLGETGAEATPELRRRFIELAATIENQLGVRVRTVGESLDGVLGRFSGVKGREAVKGFTVAAVDGARAVGIAYEQLKGQVGAVLKTLSDAEKRRQDLRVGQLPAETDRPRDGAGAAGGTVAAERARLDAIQELLRARLDEVALLGRTEEAAYRVRLEQELVVAAQKTGRAPLIEEVAILGSILQRRQEIGAAVAEEKRATSVGEVLAQLRRENELLEAQGVARQALRREQEAEIALSRIKGGATDEERERLAELLAANRSLLEIEEQRRNETRVAAREGAAEFRRVKEAQDEARAAAAAFGSSAGDALGRIIIDGQRARDVVEDLARAMARQALASMTARFLTMAGTALAGAFIGGGAGAGAGVGAGGNAFAGNTPSQTSANYSVPYMTGGVIPAMGGQVIDEFGFMRRGGRTYSVAEGGKTTPEGIFPLARDDRGRLGVVAAGGGGDTFNMSFPGVRTQADARAVRATMSQQLRRARAADRTGRRGLRPRD